MKKFAMLRILIHENRSRDIYRREKGGLNAVVCCWLLTGSPGLISLNGFPPGSDIFAGFDYRLQDVHRV
jgi:hypothetical protein